MPGDVGDFSVNIGLGINFLAFVSQFVTLRDTLTYSKAHTIEDYNAIHSAM